MLQVVPQRVLIELTKGLTLMEIYLSERQYHKSSHCDELVGIPLSRTVSSSQDKVLIHHQHQEVA